MCHMHVCKQSAVQKIGKYMGEYRIKTRFKLTNFSQGCNRMLHMNIKISVLTNEIFAKPGKLFRK